MSTSDSVSALPFVFVDYATAPIAALAKDIIAADKPNPSNLSSYTIWSESRAEIHSIKLNLIKAGQAAGINHLLLPNIITLQDWVCQQDTTDKQLISETNKQLLLVEAIRQSPTLFQTNNAWPLANELVSLFNECTLAQIPLQEGEQALRDLLHDCYQFPTANATNISRESEIVYRLWQAYREQIEAREWIDPIDYYCQWLVNVDASYLQTDQHYFLVGKHRLCAAEVIFLQKTAQATNNVSIYSPRVSPHQHGAHLHPHVRFLDETTTIKSSNDSREQALDIIFDRTHHTYDRIGQLKATIPSNIFNHWLSIYKCNSIENHVIAVSLQAKKWLTEGINSIGIVVNDRLLARRIRAVLEEQGIQPTDLGGWTLSTTSAATSIEVLLDAIEHNFKKEQLLDLLSNPFLPGNHNNDASFTHQTYELRKHLKKHRNTATDNLDVMTELAMQHFASKKITCKELSETLATINSACSSLQKSKDFGEHEISQLSDNLISTLKDLGIYETLTSDIAGKQLIEVFQSHTQNSRNSSIKITWEEWRQWLRDLLENNYFIPGNTDKRITLCGFEHTDNMQFEAVIIAGVEENRLTNTKSHRTFFNEKVCHELHLPTNHESNAINFVRFRQLIQQCDTVLLSAETEIRGEAQELSSWVKLMSLFCEQSYASILDNTELNALTQAYKQYKNDKYIFTNYKTMQPQPSAPAELIPRRISATQYQSLMDCPYQYFAKYVLELRDQQTADDFEASDYGMLVHKSLYDFHFSDDNKTDLAFSIDNRHPLIKQLTELSTSVFMHAAFPPTIKQAWLQRWITNIPAYIQWAIERAEDWRALRGESLLQRHFNDEFSIYGQIDRIDSDTKHLAVTDYKTGSTKPSKKNVMRGEVVQLPFYALLDENITQAEYLSLGTQGEVKTTALLNEEELTQLRAEHQPRLESLLSALINDAKLSAQGDDNTCRVCDYHGLCRKQHWN